MEDTVYARTLFCSYQLGACPAPTQHYFETISFMNISESITPPSRRARPMTKYTNEPGVGWILHTADLHLDPDYMVKYHCIDFFLSFFRSYYLMQFIYLTYTFNYFMNGI